VSRTLTWVPASGNPVALTTDSRVYAGRGAQVIGMPPTRYSELVVPLQSGARWQQVEHGPVDIAIPVHITGDKDAEMDRLTAALDPTLGEGRLRQTRDNGTERELYCRYVDGLRPSEQFYGEQVWTAALLFRAVDPYWYDRNSSSLIFSPGESPSFFPFFPLTLGASEVSTEATVNNDGHVTTWPVWTITGPGSVTATNTTTGETWDLDYTLDDGEVVTVDTRPGVKTVTSSTDGDLFANLTDESSLWALAKGTNTVTVTMAAASSASKLLLSWQRRWLTG
jgi:hypothetical protein